MKSIKEYNEYCSYNKLTELDVSKNTKLLYIDK